MGKKTAEKIMWIAAMEAFYLKASHGHGWATGVKGAKVLGTSGFQRYEFEEGDFHFRQNHGIFNAHYRPDPSRVSLSDIIMISYKGKDAWMLTLNGHCRKEDLPFLQRALMEAYAYNGRGKFHGGRGLVHHLEEGYPNEYVNSAHGAFHNFGGTEGIRPLGKVVSEYTGQTEYRGWLITPRSR